jgi:hypothetical protein
MEKTGRALPGMGEVSTQGVHTNEEMSTGETKKPRGSLRPPAELYDEFIELKRDDESTNDLLKRLIDTANGVDALNNRITDLVTLNEHLQVTVDELDAIRTSEQEQSTVQIDALKHRISGLEADIEHLIDEGASTALTTPSEQSQLDLGGDVLKDTIDAVKGACGDEESCVKTALHLIDTKASLVNSQSSRDHDARQKDLDRDERDKDRKLKQDLADGKAKHEKDLAMIKKGIVHEADLEGVIFLGEHRHKSAKAAIEDRKEQARRESEADEEWKEPEAED